MSNDKYKYLPCITLIKTGYCPYKNKCKFIHQKEFKSGIISSIKLRDKIDNTKDLFYYPPKKVGKRDNLGDEYSFDYVKQKRLPIFIHLSHGHKMEEYNEYLEKKSKKIRKKYDFNDKDVQTSNMLKGLLNFVNSNKTPKDKRQMKILENNDRKSPVSITGIN
jgi:hypothetical protein